MELELILGLAVVAAPLLVWLGAVGGGTRPAGTVPERADMEDEHTWDLSTLYADLPAWNSAFADCETLVGRLSGLRGRLAESPDTLLEVLETRDELGVLLERVFAYAALLRDQDLRQAEPQAMFDRARTLAVRAHEAASWLEPELLALEEDTLKQWCGSNERLAVYGHFFRNLLRQREHVLSAREEELLAMAGKVGGAAQQAYTMLANADLKFPTIRDEQGQDVELSEARYSRFLQSPDRDLRRRAFEGTLRTYLAFRNTIAATLAGSVEKDIFQARARHYASALEAALDVDNVPVKVYANLIATVREHLPKLHRYMEIRRRTLGLDRVHLYDTFVPLTGAEPPRIDYPAALGGVQEGLAALGSEYAQALSEGLAGRWIDVYETQGKRSGAYSLGTYSHHPYVLLNYNGTYKDMFTIAHELGHALHTRFTQRSQPPVYGDYPIFLAEVASTTNEVLLGAHLRERAADRAEKLFLLDQAIENIRGTVITQTIWADFEQRVHAEAEAGGALTFDTMAGLYRELVQEYYGPAYAHDEEVDGYWLRIPHFYRGFYVYKYATSFCAAVALAGGLSGDQPQALHHYLGFLRAGSSDYPLEILRRAGVDLSTPQPIADTMNLFGTLLDELELLQQH